MKIVVRSDKIKEYGRFIDHVNEVPIEDLEFQSVTEVASFIAQILKMIGEVKTIETYEEEKTKREEEALAAKEEKE